jgi:single-strand DNA-binding protein
MTMNETYVTVSGNVVGELVVRVTRANVPFVTFRVASNVRRVDFKTGEYVDAGTNFVNVTAFRALGVNLSNSLKKGEPVIVYGRMRINQWVNGERSGTTVEIDAYNVGHDLSWGQSTFRKVAKAELNQSDRMADPEVQSAADHLEREADTGRVACSEKGEGPMVCLPLTGEGSADPGDLSIELESVGSPA